jgi:hypothetical protein
MSFDEEWAQYRTTGPAQEPSATRINGVPSEGGTGDSSFDVKVNYEDLGAIGHEAYVLHGQLRTDGDIARESSFKAATVLSENHFGVGSELSTAAELWNSKLNTLLQACAHISNHLDYSSKTHAQEDADIAATMKRRDGSPLPASQINDLFR